MNADAVFADYSIDAPLDGAALDRMRHAILTPQSPPLREALEAGLDGERRYSRSDAFQALHDAGLKSDAMRFRSEALERMVLCNMVGDRLGGLSDAGKPLWLLREVNEQAANTYTPLDIPWDWPALERLIRARVHGTETIGASNSLSMLWQHYDPAPILAAMLAPDEAIRARLERQVRRLEAAEARVRESAGRDGYFKPQDAALLEALIAVTGARSATMDRIDEERAATIAERARLVSSVSPAWRDLFDRLFDLHHVSGGKPEPEVAAVTALPETAALLAEDGTVRGTVLAEVNAMQAFMEQVRDGKAALPPGVNGGIGLGEIRHPEAAGFLRVLAELLLAKPVACGDPAMAVLVTRAGSWRALCRPGLLDSAERTLAAGPAPETEAALRALADRPSHCFVPTPGRGGDFEGDSWWQDAPPRIRRMLAGRPPPSRPAPPTRPGMFGQILFGRKKG